MPHDLKYPTHTCCEVQLYYFHHCNGCAVNSDCRDSSITCNFFLRGPTYFLRGPYIFSELLPLASFSLRDITTCLLDSEQRAYQSKD